MSQDRSSAAVVQDLAREREQAAADLEAMILAVGVAYRAYERLTTALSDRTHEDLARRLDVPIVLHLARAGLSGFLERKLTGTPASLRVLVEDQHARLIEPFA